MRVILSSSNSIGSFTVLAAELLLEAVAIAWLFEDALFDDET